MYISWKSVIKHGLFNWKLLSTVTITNSIKYLCFYGYRHTLLFINCQMHYASIGKLPHISQSMLIKRPSRECFRCTHRTKNEVFH